MSAPESILQAQLASLLKLVDERRDGQCGKVREDADAQRARILQEAFAEARQRMAEAVAEERARTRRQLSAAQAQLQTRARQERHHIAQLMLHQGWEQLQEALNARWKNKETRDEWIDAVLRQALATLPSLPWTVEHPPRWDPSEFSESAGRVQAHTGAPPRFLPRDDIAGGLRICADGACLDGTQQGLLCDRTAVEARLLAHINRLSAAQRSTSGGPGEIPEP